MAGWLVRPFWFAALLLALLGPALISTAGAQQLQRPAATAGAADDRLLLQELQGKLEGRVSIPNQSAGLLQQPQGREWRGTRNGPIYWGIAIVSLGMLAAILLFHLFRGGVRMQSPPSGRMVKRFSGFERFTHWMTAISFIVLALTGVNLVFGRYLLMPLMGWETFAAMTEWGKFLHNFLSFPFVIGIVLMLVMWVADNLPARRDWVWLKQGGGFFTRSGAHIETGRFNPGQKMIFWAVVLFGAAISVTGYVLMFPLSVTDVNGMQLMQIIHAAAAGILIAIIIAHIYTGTMGVEGSFSAMGSGKVDVNWAREHHSLWLEQQEAKARESGARGATMQGAGDD